MTTVSCVGLAVHDVIFTLDTLPSGPGKTHAIERHETGGGPAANAAAAIATLGDSARFIGVVGEDLVGDAITRELADRGVDTSRVRRLAGYPSPLSAVAVDRSGERAIVNHTDPAMFAGAAPPTDEDLEGSSAVLADVRWPQGAAASLRWARDNRIAGVLDYDLGDENGSDLARLASHVVFSAPALARLTGISDPQEGLLRARDISPAWLAVTQGANGTLWLDDGEPQQEPAFPVDAVDTTGAGDVYHGVFALEVGRGADERTAMRTASAAAALSCTRLGGRDGVPTRTELDDYMKEAE